MPSRLRRRGAGGSGAWCRHSLRLLRTCAERLKFGIGSCPLVPSSPAARDGEPKQPRRLVLRAALQCEFRAVEIDPADLVYLCGSIWVVGCGKHGLRGHLAEIKPDDRRWPLGHVHLARRLRKSASEVAAFADNIQPKSSECI